MLFTTSTKPPPSFWPTGSRRPAGEIDRLAAGPDTSRGRVPEAPLERAYSNTATSMAPLKTLRDLSL